MLYRVFVESVEGATVQLRVTALDAEPIPVGLVFAFARICEPLVGIVQCSPPVMHKRTAPLAAEVSLDDYLDTAFLKANAAGFVASAESLSAQPQRKTVSLKVVATDECWVEHLRKGMRFETGSAHAEGDADEWTTPRRRGDTLRVVQKDDELAGARLAAPTDPKIGRYVTSARCHAEEYVVPVHGALFYVLRKPAAYERSVDGEWSDAARDAVRALVGQPVIYHIGRYPAGVGCLLDVREKHDTAVVFSERADSFGIHTFPLECPGDDKNRVVHWIGRALYEERQRIVPPPLPPTANQQQQAPPPALMEEDDPDPVDDDANASEVKTERPGEPASDSVTTTRRVSAEESPPPTAKKSTRRQSPPPPPKEKRDTSLSPPTTAATTKVKRHASSSSSSSSSTSAKNKDKNSSSKAKNAPSQQSRPSPPSDAVPADDDKATTKKSTTSTRTTSTTPPPPTTTARASQKDEGAPADPAPKKKMKNGGLFGRGFLTRRRRSKKDDNGTS